MRESYGLKPLDDAAVHLLIDFYYTLIGQRKHCYFCQGGNTCRCGQCPEIEYHDTDCLVTLLDRIIWNYRRNKETTTESHSLMLTTVEEIQWYRERIIKLEEKLGIDSDFDNIGDDE